MTALQPCPFCGDPAPIVESDGYTSYVQCNGCGATGPPFEEDEPAVEGWNRRSPGIPQNEGRDLV